MSSNHAYLDFPNFLQISFIAGYFKPDPVSFGYVSLVRYDIIILIKYGTNWLILLNGHNCFGFQLVFKK